MNGKPLKIIALGVLLLCAVNFASATEENPPKPGDTIVNSVRLSQKQQSIVLIASFTARGDQENLRAALSDGLDAGLSINEIKEILVQMYAYTGFPRSLNAINTFIAVLDERKAKGIHDEAGENPPGFSDRNKYEKGKRTLEILTGREETKPTGANAFAPAEWFSGVVWLNSLVKPSEIEGLYAIGQVTFEAAARTYWHTHPAGQVLLCTGGNGWYQERGKPARALKKGDTVVIPKNVEHWHGAANNSPFVHIAITNYKKGSGVTWLNPVSDAEYDRLAK